MVDSGQDRPRDNSPPDAPEGDERERRRRSRRPAAADRERGHRASSQHGHGVAEGRGRRSKTRANDGNGGFKERKGGRRGRKSQPSPPWSRSGHPDDPQVHDLQTHYKALGDNAQTHLARSFVLSVAMMGVFYGYEKVHVLSKHQRRMFNLLGTGLYLTLGLNLAASLKSMAILVRWRLLARKRHHLEEIDFLLGLQSLIKVFNYGRHSLTRQPWTAFACFAWILVNTVGRLSVALTGITYSYDSANATAVMPGTVTITDWNRVADVTAFVDESEVDDNWILGAEHYAAHTNGLFSSTLAEQNSSQVVNDVNSPLYAPIEITDDGFLYYFREFKPASDLAYKTTRSVKVTAECSQYPITDGQKGQGTEITFLNGTSEETLTTPDRFGPASTTWLNPRGDLPKNIDWSCGPRCAVVIALQYRDTDDDRDGALYKCNINVFTVNGGTEAAHEIPDNIAQIVAGAIGLEGYSNGPNDWEYSRYPPGSSWSNYRGGIQDDAAHMARLAARFAIGSLAIKDLFGSKEVVTEGHAAWIGVLLKIKWPWLFAILGSILAVQLLMGVSAAIYANQVFCKDDSFLSTARLLRPIVERLGPAGCAVTGKEIAHTLQQEMSYGIRIDETGERMHLDIGEDIQPSGKFPEGWYDGNLWEEEKLL